MVLPATVIRAPCLIPLLPPFPPSQLQVSPCPSWVSPKIWPDVLKLPQLNETLHTLPGHMTSMAWKAVMNDSAAPYSEDWPSPFDRCGGG